MAMRSGLSLDTMHTPCCSFHVYQTVLLLSVGDGSSMPARCSAARLSPLLHKRRGSASSRGSALSEALAIEVDAAAAEEGVSCGCLAGASACVFASNSTWIVGCKAAAPMPAVLGLFAANSAISACRGNAEAGRSSPSASSVTKALCLGSICQTDVCCLAHAADTTLNSITKGKSCR